MLSNVCLLTFLRIAVEGTENHRSGITEKVGGFAAHSVVDVCNRKYYRSVVKMHAFVAVLFPLL
jgi:hypothetical protein